MRSCSFRRVFFRKRNWRSQKYSNGDKENREEISPSQASHDPVRENDS